MRKYLTLLFFVILVSCQSQQGNSLDQKPSDTNEINSDSTKSQSQEKKIENDAWSIGSFIDEFGESNGGKYVQTITYGTFSNSATSNEYLMVKISLTTKNAGLFLHEYDDNQPAQKFIGTGKIRLKNEEGKDLTVYSFSEWNPQGGLLIEGDNFKKLRDFLLSSNGKIKAVVYDDYSSVYNFSIDLSSFGLHYTELKDSKGKK